MPGDVSPAGYGDIPFVRDRRPALTIVDVPCEEPARPAASRRICRWARRGWCGARWRRPATHAARPGAAPPLRRPSGTLRRSSPRSAREW
ncbi:hypothetical protein [Streptomyces sp. NPDC052721]|uniref:hypothetical protein n=1 Tax=Streptomyces sp. NPDC052721 TaxID=3154955 RepID=UPI00342AC3CA